MRPAIVHAACSRDYALAVCLCRRLRVGLARMLLVCLLSPLVLADPGCPEQARGAYERLYCKIKAEGGGAGLPTLGDFRRNSAQTQALLLRRPASRLGLRMPAPSKEQSPAERHAPEAGAHAKKGAAADSETGSPAHAGIASCSLDQRTIRCGEQTYQLLGNKPKSQVPPSALSSANQLRLPSYRGAGGDETALRDYLRRSYEHYLEKMLSIGLASSTMSFTKFYYTYQEVREQGADFGERMQQMFAYLKRDRKSLGVQESYSDRLPQDLRMCGRLNDRLIVCDDADTNWVFELR